MYNQLATPMEAAFIALQLGGIGGGVVDTYVPEYGGPFVPPENGDKKFLHFRFANGADGFNVGLIRAFMEYSPMRWPEMIATQVYAEAKDQTIKGTIPKPVDPSVPAPTPTPAAVIMGPDLETGAGADGRYVSMAGDTAPIGTRFRAADGMLYIKRGNKSLGGAVSMFWVLA